MLSCPELLSPAGSLEALKYAVMYGADAVYCALPRFGMRAAPVNLPIGELHDGCIFAHARGKKVYLTLNNLPTNDELSELPQSIKAAAEAGEENGKEHFKDIPDNKPTGPLSQDQQTEVKTTLSRGPMFSEVR